MLKIQCELEQVVQLKTKGKAVFTFDKKHAGHFTNFSDKPLTIEVLVDTPKQQKRLAQISGEQRRKIFAVIRDIADFVGRSADDMRDNLTALYCHEKQMEVFSLSDCSKEIASDYIEWLIKWAFEYGVELKEHPRTMFDDVERYHETCVDKKVCSVCGKAGEVHHVDTIGMGRNRKTIDDSNYKKVCLCRVHHSEAHNSGWETFKRKYHL